MLAIPITVFNFAGKCITNSSYVNRAASAAAPKVINQWIFEEGAIKLKDGEGGILTIVEGK